jgi:glycerophosphoryl diester phosphodiesterase
MLLALTCFGSCLAWHGCTTPAADRPIELPTRGLCAHRGAMDTHPENTLAAYREAIRVGAQMIELDVHMSKDGHLVVMHDPKVDRTTNGSGAIADLTLAEIRALDAGSHKGEAFRGEKVPTLDEALAVMPRNIWLNIHLKEGENLGARVAAEVVRAGRLHQAFLACGAADAQAAREVAAEILICNMDRDDNGWGYVRNTIAMGAQFIQLRGHLRPEIADYVAELKKHGVRVNYYGGKNNDDYRTLFGYGVDFPLVNDIAEAMVLADEQGFAPVRPVYR